MVILYILLCFVVVILMRALVFTPKATAQREFEKVEVDEEHCVKALAELVKCKTVSRTEPELEDDAEFEKLIGKLPQLYPNVWASCPLTRLDGRALLFKWAGREAGEAAVLMAHYDVVPVEEENWLHPAFDALIEDGVMWGRGTLDTKVTFNGIMCAAEAMIKAGFQPKNDVYFAFSGGEEVNGPGAKNIVEYFKENNVALKLVLDEGGAVVENVFPGVTKPCGLIGIAEKGLLN
ncbi:MAG: M20/M25/M40 family metallo-hydrolase, partial [Oscillospiraceae bacterium]|nr:M20/M25/M40 family metallo-hydrolase [Oscillospiraceae bacterium]